MRVLALLFCLLLPLAASAAKPEPPEKAQERGRVEIDDEPPQRKEPEKPGLEAGKKAPPDERDFNPDAEHCSDPRNCDRRCYSGPSDCVGRRCSRDFVCRPKGYDPWHGKPREAAPAKVPARPDRRRARRDQAPPANCNLFGPMNCPAGCYRGPRSCVGQLCTSELVCAGPGYNPYSGGPR